MNKVLVKGSVLKAPVSFSQKAPAKFMIKVELDKQIAFVPVEAWGKQKDIALEHLSAGTEVWIGGRYTTGSYEKDGKKVYTTSVTADVITSEKAGLDEFIKAEAPKKETKGGF